MKLSRDRVNGNVVMGVMGQVQAGVHDFTAGGDVGELVEADIDPGFFRGVVVISYHNALPVIVGRGRLALHNGGDGNVVPGPGNAVDHGRVDSDREGALLGVDPSLVGGHGQLPGAGFGFVQCIENGVGTGVVCVGHVGGRD